MELRKLVWVIIRIHTQRCQNLCEEIGEQEEASQEANRRGLDVRILHPMKWHQLSLRVENRTRGETEGTNEFPMTSREATS